jgi:hypothetical protein
MQLEELICYGISIIELVSVLWNISQVKSLFDMNISWDCYRREIWIVKLVPDLCDKSVLFYELWLYSAGGK